MKKFFIFLLVLILLIEIVKAQEEPKYNFGSMQADSELNIAPGETAITKLYFYNIHGNRITHIALSVGGTSENWDITIEPALHKTKVKVSGVLTTIEENLYVEPSEAVEEIPATISEGIEYISSAVGYIGAKPVKVKITVPENEKLGKVAKVRIDGTANWLDQTGGIALKQGRSFDYSVNVISKEFIEEVGPELEKPKVEETKELEKEKVEEKQISEVIETTKEIVKEKGISPVMFYSTVIVLVIIILILLIFFIKGKKKKEKK